MRAFSVLICLLVTLAQTGLAQTAKSNDKWPSYGVMTLEDHKAYFRPGAYLAFMIDYDITRRDVLIDVDWGGEGDDVSVTETWSSVSVSENLLGQEGKPFVKMAFDPVTSTSNWLSFRSGFSAEVTAEALEEEQDMTRVWLSDNNDLTIRDTDVHWGTEAEYYDAAFKLSDGECCLSPDEYEAVIVGQHVSNCSFVAHKTWEVMCITRNLDAGVSWRTYLVRLEDAIG